ncbi:MAG TPA: 23S rRNA (uracil(1939)-C(5))-methyltransferase RlmD [Bacteroidales bacterium]|nr:23S rRNA (uracil(1939)-C(5))-methyltransferase RlmD [Bacteroidales bacterium]
MGRKKNLPVLERVLITDIGAEGNAVARVDGQVVFVPMLVPGDVADIRVIRKRKKFMEGLPLKFHEYSGMRIEPVCRHFGICGGCKWQHLPYSEQLKWKMRQVSDNLSRIGGIDLPEIMPVLGSENRYCYRNKLEFTFSNRKWLTREEIESGEVAEHKNALGFHIPGLFDKVLDIEFCHLQDEPVNAIRNEISRYSSENGLEFFDLREQKGLLRNLIVRNTLSGEIMVIVVFFYDDPEKRKNLLDHIASEFPAITSLMYIINPKKNDSISDLGAELYKGKDHLVEHMDGLKFRVGPKSFYQTNSRQGERLYRVVRDFAALKGDETVYDLYTGTGTIANYVARSASKVIGIEYVAEAIADARQNSGINGISNTIFFTGDIKNILTGSFMNENGAPDVIITDPPRAGMHEDVVRVVLSSLAGRIVYVSCNPATQARDLKILDEKYRVEAVQPVDMFPQTHHIENVVLLIKR